jgi:hypothetical protein
MAASPAWWLIRLLPHDRDRSGYVSSDPKSEFLGNTSECAQRCNYDGKRIRVVGTGIPTTKGPRTTSLKSPLPYVFPVD